MIEVEKLRALYNGLLELGEDLMDQHRSTPVSDLPYQDAKAILEVIDLMDFVGDLLEERCLDWRRAKFMVQERLDRMGRLDKKFLDVGLDLNNEQ